MQTALLDPRYVDKVKLKDKLTAFTEVIRITCRGGGIMNIQSQSKILLAGGHTVSNPVSHFCVLFHLQFIQEFSLSTHRLSMPIAYPHLQHYFHSHGTCQQSPISKSETFATSDTSLLLSD